jgi:hypothetical protein
MSKKIGATVSDEFYNRFTAYAKQLGLNYSQLGSICLQAGFGHVQRAINPEQALSPAQIAAIIKAGKDIGLDVELDQVLKEV